MIQTIGHENARHPGLFSQAFAAFSATTVNDLTTICRRHALAEPAYFFTLDLRWSLQMFFHNCEIIAQTFWKSSLMCSWEEPF